MPGVERYRCSFQIPISQDLKSFYPTENYRQSALDVLNAKNNNLQAVHESWHSNSNYVEQSWIYNLCLKCRTEEPSASWEPPFWQKIFPYPLCPTFRTFSRLVSLIAIGESINPIKESLLTHLSPLQVRYYGSSHL